MIVTVSGRSRSGKSVLAHALVRSLLDSGISALRVRLDDWIVPATERTPGMSAETRNRVASLPGVLDALCSAVAVRAPGYDALSRCSVGPVLYEPEGHDVLVLEGCFANHSTIRNRLD